MAAQILRQQAAALTRLLTAAALALAGAQLGCASHSEHTALVRSALDAGRPEQAVKALDDEMEVKSPDDQPSDLKSNNALLLLDRASVHLALGQHARSRRDFEAADKAIDLLDLSSNAGDTIGNYVFSGSSAKYIAPPYEKLLINTLNLLNYLETDDIDGAKVEVRRLDVMRRYLSEHKQDKESPVVGLSGFLAGLTFERAGDGNEALRYYDEAMAEASFGWLRDPVRSLLATASYRTPRLEALTAGLPPLKPPAETNEGELIVVLGFGRVPHKIAKRVPIGLALTYFADAISPTDQAAASRLAAQGLVTWVNYPTLGPERGGYASPAAWIDDRPVGLEEAIDVTSEVRREWEKAEGKIVASAITRMIARFAAGEAARTALGRDSIVGLLASLGTQATLTALDTPDTRSWETLPARIAVARVRLPAGSHRLTLSARESTRSATIDLKPGGYQVVSLFALR